MKEEKKLIIFRELDDVKIDEGTAVALGNFDGVHLGHQKLIKEAVKYAEKHGLKTLVFTFSNHPKNVLGKGTEVKCILCTNGKASLIESLGVDYLVDVPFTEEIMKTPAESFVKDLLVDKMNIKAAFCGFNYKFGFKAKGTPELLRTLGEEYGFAVKEMKAYKLEDNVVSSTLIRTLIASGRVDRCRTYMGRLYSITGEVVVGNRLGRKLGFPTSNLVIDPTMVTPPNGVYVTNCIYNGVSYASITNVGVKPTIGEYTKNVETHIFDFNKELYGKSITVEFIKKMRDEVKFDSVEDLSEQIVRDCREARKYHEQLAKKAAKQAKKD